VRTDMILVSHSSSLASILRCDGVYAGGDYDFTSVFFVPQ
jgi:hypothetical protein